MAVVGAVRHAIQVKSSGLDIIVAQGHDGGGHNSPVGTMALIPQVVDAVGDTPVLGAGGISDGRGVAAALMLGAEGVWVGSAFLASEEASIFDFQKQAIVDATEEGTSVSRTVTGKPARIIRSKWTEHWVREDVEPLPMPYQGMISGPVMAAANRDGRGDINPGFAGQGIGMIKAVRPAKEIFDELVYWRGAGSGRYHQPAAIAPRFSKQCLGGQAQTRLLRIRRLVIALPNTPSPARQCCHWC